MTDYRTKTYGRNKEVNALFAIFDARQDVSMHGPRRLGKTFVLDRMVEQAHFHDYTCIKVEIAGCSDTHDVSCKLCEAIDAHKSQRKRVWSILKQRGVQFISPQKPNSGPWHKIISDMDWDKYLERLLKEINNSGKKWAILIDELPIFLKALHDREAGGIALARNFMNNFSQIRSNNPNIRWLITGSIGIMPLAETGEYMGVLAKLRPFLLDQLTKDQAIDFLQDLPQLGMIIGRQVISTQEAQAIIDAVGWRTPYYLDALASHLPTNPETVADNVQKNIAAAMESLLQHYNRSTFGTWEEHLRKHHSGDQQRLSFNVLNTLASEEEGLTIDALLAALNAPALDRHILQQHLNLMIDEGFLFQDPYGENTAPYRFRLLPLRLWWQRFRPEVKG